MKAALLLAALAFAGCETIEHEDGSVTQRVDTRAIRDGIDAGSGAYQFYRNQQQPGHGTPAYQQRLYYQGQVIPSPYQQQAPAYYP